MKETTRRWWRAAAIRALKTMAQTAAATIGAAAVLSQVDWPVVASAGVLAGVLSPADLHRRPAGSGTGGGSP